MRRRLLCLFVSFIQSFCLHDATGAYHRLQLPGPTSELQIVPRIEVPMAMAPSIQSGMNIRLPISLKFADRKEATSHLTAKSMTQEEVYNTSLTTSRASLYQMIEKVSPTLGKACLLRSICEVGQVPAVSPATGLLGEIVDLLLT